VAARLVPERRNVVWLLPAESGAAGGGAGGRP
jgi:hypothetical protein